MEWFFMGIYWIIIKNKKMTVTYNWIVEDLITKPQEGNLKDVVVFVQWRRTGEVLYNNQMFYASDFGSMACESPSETDFTAYDSLTCLEVCKWLENGLPVATIDKVIKENLERQVNPPTIILPLPWQKTEEPTPKIEEITQTDTQL